MHALGVPQRDAEPDLAAVGKALPPPSPSVLDPNNRDSNSVMTQDVPSLAELSLATCASVLGRSASARAAAKVVSGTMTDIVDRLGGGWTTDGVVLAKLKSKSKEIANSGNQVKNSRKLTGVRGFWMRCLTSGERRYYANNDFEANLATKSSSGVELTSANRENPEKVEDSIPSLVLPLPNVGLASSALPIDALPALPQLSSGHLGELPGASLVADDAAGGQASREGHGSMPALPLNIAPVTTLGEPLPLAVTPLPGLNAPLPGLNGPLPGLDGITYPPIRHNTPALETASQFSTPATFTGAVPPFPGPTAFPNSGASFSGQALTPMPSGPLHHLPPLSQPPLPPLILPGLAVSQPAISGSQSGNIFSGASTFPSSATSGFFGFPAFP